MMKNEKWATCPHCNSNAEKIDGCNFMTCESPICNAGNSFCYLCNAKLEEDDHFTHFIDDDPFEKPCKG
jgi:hypothetical protein